MNDNLTNNTNENIEEVPLDLFNQVSLDDYEPEKPIEVVDLGNQQPQQEESNEVISIPAGAYEAALAAMSSGKPQQ